MEKGLIFTYVMTYGGALLALANPFYGLLVYICFSIVRPEYMWHWAVPAGNYSRIVALALLFGWLFKGFGNWTWGRGTLIVCSLLGFMFWAAFGMVLSASRSAALDYVELQGKIVLPFLVGITLIESTAQLKQLAWVIMASHGYVAYELNLSYFVDRNVLYHFGFGDMDNNCVAIAMVTCLGLAFFLGLHAEKLWQKAIAFVCALFMAHAIFFAYSRGGMIALIITGLFSFWLIPKTPRHYVAFAVGCLLLLRLAGPEVQERFLTVFAREQERDQSASSRLEMWGYCLKEMADSPLFGQGPNHWGLNVEKYGFPKGKLAHTLWLQTGAELGVPGLAFLMLFYLSCMWRLWPLARGKQRTTDPELGNYAQMVIASLVGFMVSAQFVSLSGLETPFYITLIGAGVLKLASVPSAEKLGAMPGAAFRTEAAPAVAGYPGV